MSDLSRTNARGITIEDQAGYWLERRDFDDMSKDELASFDAWIAKSLAHRVAFVRLEAAWGRTERLAALRAYGGQQETRSALKIGKSPFLQGLAALAVAAFLGTGAAWFLLNSAQKVYTAPIGGHRTVVLADGSVVELNTDTILRVAEDSGGRIAELEKGEAYFQIKHDASNPFVVKVAGHRITDLGTKFLVRADANRVEVALAEGGARIDSFNASKNSRSVILKPGDVAIAAGENLSVTKFSREHLTDTLGWRRGVLIFDHTTLAEAADEVNRYNKKKLVIADAEAGRFMIGGTFPTNGVDTIAAAAKDFFGLRVEDRGDEILISR